MKRTLSTAVLFVLLILTVLALTKIGRPHNTSALAGNVTTVKKDAAN